MKAMFLRWLVAGILGLGVIFTVSSEDVAKPEPEAATLTKEEMETILDTKFSEGKYSRRGPDAAFVAMTIHQINLQRVFSTTFMASPQTCMGQ